MLMVQVDGTDILLVNLNGDIRATQGVCSHEYFELDKGFLTGDSVTCALHLSRFDLFSGEALDPPAVMPLMRWTPPSAFPHKARLRSGRKQDGLPG